MSMRTVKRDTITLNKVKQADLKLLCSAYSRQKNNWLDTLKNWKWQALLNTPRKIRDTFMLKGNQSAWNMQARHWKLALQDAVETWDKYWKALCCPAKAKNCPQIQPRKKAATLTGY